MGHIRGRGKRPALLFLKTDDELDPIFKALADPTRRGILDALRNAPQTTSALAELHPELSRFAVMKHLNILKDAGLVLSEKNGRVVTNRLNTAPIRQVYMRWVTKYEEIWAHNLLAIKNDAEHN